MDVDKTRSSMQREQLNVKNALSRENLARENDAYRAFRNFMGSQLTFCLRLPRENGERKFPTNRFLNLIRKPQTGERDMYAQCKCRKLYSTCVYARARIGINVFAVSAWSLAQRRRELRRHSPNLHINRV